MTAILSAILVLGPFVAGCVMHLRRRPQRPAANPFSLGVSVHSAAELQRPE